MHVPPYSVHSLLGTGVQQPLIKRACGVVGLLPCFAVLYSFKRVRRCYPKKLPPPSSCYELIKY